MTIKGYGNQMKNRFQAKEVNNERCICINEKRKINII